MRKVQGTEIKGEFPKSGIRLFSRDDILTLGYSAISTLALVDNASEPMWLAQDIGIRNNSEFEMKVKLL